MIPADDIHQASAAWLKGPLVSSNGPRQSVRRCSQSVRLLWKAVVLLFQKAVTTAGGDGSVAWLLCGILGEKSCFFDSISVLLDDTHI